MLGTDRLVDLKGVTMHRIPGRILLITAAFALLLVPVAAIAAGGFEDVEDDNVFKADIDWLANAGVTKGCNPPANTEFCPSDNVTREQMAAFMHRLAVNRVVDADSVDGRNASAFAASGHDHNGDYLAKTGKAADADLLDGVDASQFASASRLSVFLGEYETSKVKIRYRDQAFYTDTVDLFPDRMFCVTDSVIFDTETTVVASGGMSLDPIGTSTAIIYGYVTYSSDGGNAWYNLNGTGVEATPNDGTGDAAVPINAVGTLDAGSYLFAILPYGSNHQTGNDYGGHCELTVTAYPGQAVTDAVIQSAELDADDHKDS